MNIYKKERLGLTITFFQLFFLNLIFSKIVNSHIKILYNPFFILQIIYKPSTIIYLISFSIPIILRYALRHRAINNFAIPFLYTISALLFNLNFPNTTNIFLNKSAKLSDGSTYYLLINTNFLLICIVSLISGFLLSFRSNYFTLGYTEIEGIFRYYNKISKEMCTRIINVWFVDLLFSYGGVVFYYLVFRFIINFILLFFRIKISQSSSFSVFNQIIFTNISVLVYYSILEFLDRLLIFNLSLKYKDLNNFSLINKQKDFNSLFIKRYIFYHVSGLSYKYTYVLNNILRDKKDLKSLIIYIEEEVKEIKNILMKMKDEFRELDNRLYMTVPQINNTKCSKKYINYNLIDKLTYKMIYKYRIYKLKTDFNVQIKYMEDINKYMNYLVKHIDYFLLLKDVNERYLSIYKELVDEIRDVEEKCGIDLKIKI